MENHLEDRSEDHHVVRIDGQSLTFGEVVAVARGGVRVELDPAAHGKIIASQEQVNQFIEEDRPGYGVNTGFGSLSTSAIAPDQVTQLQLNLLHSHASGAGEPLPAEVVRAAMIMRANSLAVGYSGVKLATVETILELLNAEITPYVPCQGSLGASGDLAPLAHTSLALIGEGIVLGPAGPEPASDALAKAGIQPLELGPKEALALINGTPVLGGLAALALSDAERVVRTAIGVAGLSLFSIGARREAFDAHVHQARPHPGALSVAATIRHLIGDLDPSQRATDRIQDPYSVRCIPQVYGAILDSLRPLRQALDVEFNSATDNPLIFEDVDQPISGGNFHGHPLALPVEYAKVAMASLGTVVERRVSLLVDGEEYGLPPFLVAEAGLNSGFMIAHYLTAGLVSENKVLSHPSAVDSIPTSANIEDYNSMGTTGARHFRQVVGNVEKIIAVEAICAAQACDLRGLRPEGDLGKLYAAIREAVAFRENDERIMALDVEASRQAVHAGALDVVDLEERNG